MEWILLILFLTLVGTIIPLGLFWCCSIHPQMLREQHEFEEWKRAELRRFH